MNFEDLTQIGAAVVLVWGFAIVLFLSEGVKMLREISKVEREKAEILNLAFRCSVKEIVIEGEDSEEGIERA